MRETSAKNFWYFKGIILQCDYHVVIATHPPTKDEGHKCKVSTNAQLCACILCVRDRELAISSISR